MTIEVIRYKLNELRMMLNDGEHGEEQGILVEIIKELDKAENKGEWIKIQSGDKDFPESIVCSRCKEENSYLEFDEHHEPIHKTFITSKFCPNCGADMRGKAE